MIYRPSPRAQHLLMRFSPLVQHPARLPLFTATNACYKDIRSGSDRYRHSFSLSLSISADFPPREIIPAELGRGDIRLSRRRGGPLLSSFLFFVRSKSTIEEEGRTLLPETGIHDTFHISELIEWYTRIK